MYTKEHFVKMSINKIFPFKPRSAALTAVKAVTPLPHMNAEKWVDTSFYLKTPP